MKSVYEQDCRIDAAFSQVYEYYSVIDAKFNVVLYSASAVATASGAAIGIIIGLLAAANTAASAADAATGGAAAPAIEPARATISKCCAAILLLIAAICSLALTLPEGSIKADLANKKADIGKTNNKYQPIHAEAKIEVPRLQYGSTNGLPSTVTLSVSQMENIPKTALNNIPITDNNTDYKIKEYMKWNPSSWTDEVASLKPTWNPPKCNPPYHNIKWWQFWKYLANAAYYLYYGMIYGAYTAWYGIQYGIWAAAYGAIYLSYAIYWFGDAAGKSFYNMTKFEALKYDMNRLKDIYKN